MDDLLQWCKGQCFCRSSTGYTWLHGCSSRLHGQAEDSSNIWTVWEKNESLISLKCAQILVWSEMNIWILWNSQNMFSRNSCEIKCVFLGAFCWFCLQAFLSFSFTAVLYGEMTTEAASSLSDPIEWPDKTSVNAGLSCWRMECRGALVQNLFTLHTDNSRVVLNLT